MRWLSMAIHSSWLYQTSFTWPLGYVPGLSSFDTECFTHWIANHSWQIFSATILYMEWNRSLPHYLGSRIFWILGAIASGIKLHSLIGLSSTTHINFWNNLEVNIILTTLYVLMAVIGAVGIIPAIRKWVEPNPKLSQVVQPVDYSEDDRPASIRDFLKLVFAKGRRTALVWLLIGMGAAASKGYIMQSINGYDGQLFNEARSMNTVRWNSQFYLRCNCINQVLFPF